MARLPVGPRRADRHTGKELPPMSRTKSLLRTLLVIGAASAAAVFGTFSAFSATTENSGNRLKTGDVDLSDNDTGQALYFDLNAKPGSTYAKCIKVSYNGSLDADVKLYVPEAIGALGDYVNLKITPGTQTDTVGMACGGDFAPSAGGAIYDGELDEFKAAYYGWDHALVDGPGAATYWTSGQSVVYKVEVGVQNDSAAEGKDTNAHALVWEARNR
jgi:hypothetical protein